MLEWKVIYAPRYALFLKGDRRVGKTTLAEAFGKNEYRSYICIGFDKVNQNIKQLFVDSLNDLDTFWQHLSFNVLLNVIY